jgi:DNA-binding MarR family transcriptional regulator
MVLLHRYSVDITHIAETTLGGDVTGNREVQLVILIHLEPGVTAGRLSTLTGMSASAVSRSIRHLIALGLVSRRPSPSDARSSLVDLSRKGRLRVTRFERTLADYFAGGAPLVKETLSLLHVEPAADAPALSALAAAVAMGGVGAAYGDEVIPVMAELGVANRGERFAITLLLDRGQMRPTHLAHDLGLSTSGMTDLLDRLETSGLVQRSHDDVSDRRAVVVRLTELGERAADTQLDVFARHIDALATALALTLPHT